MKLGGKYGIFNDFIPCAYYYFLPPYRVASRRGGCLYRPDSRWPIYRQAEKCVGRLEAVAARCVAACEEEGAPSHLGSAKLRTRERDLAMEINIRFHI